MSTPVSPARADISALGVQEIQACHVSTDGVCRLLIEALERGDEPLDLDGICASACERAPAIPVSPARAAAQAEVARSRPSLGPRSNVIALIALMGFDQLIRDSGEEQAA